jgi:hypothetical protein
LIIEVQKVRENQSPHRPVRDGSPGWGTFRFNAGLFEELLKKSSCISFAKTAGFWLFLRV